MRILIITLALFLSSCTFLAKYDNNEYASFAHIAVMSETASAYCGDPLFLTKGLQDIQLESHFLKIYTKYLPNNDDTHNIAAIIDTTVNEMVTRYNGEGTPSQTYCKAKLKIIQLEAHRALEAVGKKVK